MKVMIANRGEIARRIERTCVALGHDVVGIWVDGDAGSANALLHGSVETVPSYLDQGAIVEAARRAGAQAVHPGFGFLAENAEFAQAVLDAGLIWIGPRPDVIAQMGSKIHAREIAAAARVPLIPGYAESQADADLAAAAADIGWPILVKASAGGGGKGIRIAHSPDEFPNALTEARGEAERSFGDDSVIVERFIERPRHVEVQVIGDRHGATYHLGTRECSVQRRYQKLFEEAPAPNLPDATRAGLHSAAVELAAAVSYDSAGTVEFIVDDESGDFYFLEMNTRLQVEHPVTEQVTGLDLIELMIRSACGETLPDLSQVGFAGHSLEARITAEDAGAGFAPAVGTAHLLRVPDDVRWESALVEGTEVTPQYDSMIAKLIVHGGDRAEALGRMGQALDGLIIGGVTTTAGFHRWLIDQPEIIAGRVTTRYLDEIELPPPPEPAAELAASAWRAVVIAAGSDSVWATRPGFSLTPHRSASPVGLRDLEGTVHEVTAATDSAPVVELAAVDPSGRRVAVNVAGHTHHFDVLTRTERWAPSAGDRVASGDALVAPFPAVVAEVHVAAGDQVVADQVLVVIEAMKMLHSLTATGATTIDQVRVSPGDQVAGNDTLITFASPEETP